MGITIRLCFVASCLSILVHARRASAEEATAEGVRLPVSYVERGLTLPRMILAPEVDVGEIPTNFPRNANLVNLTALAQFSILDDLTLRATVLPLQLGPDSSNNYGNMDAPGPTVGATYRFLRGDVEMGASVDVGLTTYNAFGIYFDPGLPVHVHFCTRARLDTGTYLPVQAVRKYSGTIDVSYGSVTEGGVAVPLRFAVDIVEPLHVGVSTGFQIAFDPPAGSIGDSIGIPLGIFGGYAIAGAKGPIVDIDPFFTWFQFLSGIPNSGVDAKDFEIGVAVTGYLYL